MKNKIVKFIQDRALLIVMLIVAMVPFSISLAALKNGDIVSSLLALAAAMGMVYVGWSNIGNDKEL